MEKPYKTNHTYNPIHTIAEILSERWWTEDDGTAESKAEQLWKLLERIDKVVSHEFNLWSEDDCTLELFVEGYARRRLQWAEGPSPTAEKEYVEGWLERNWPSPGVNSGEGTLQHLLSEDAPSGLGFMSEGVWELVTRRDHLVAMAVVQWLGTNVGQGFIQECERKFQERRSNIKKVTEAFFSNDTSGIPS